MRSVILESIPLKNKPMSTTHIRLNPRDMLDIYRLEYAESGRSIAVPERLFEL